MGERTAEDWGRVAVSLPGWRWMPGMLNVIPPRNDGGPGFASRILDAELTGPPPLTGLPDPDDPATAGCLLALLGPNLTAYDFGSYADEPGENGMRFRVVLYGDNKGKPLSWPPVDCATLGRACIAAAEALGRWPGGGTE